MNETAAVFRLGALTVRPLSHEIVAEGGVEVLEPRVMAVLAVLAERRGTVVTRDCLVERCWAGRAVSEDAIQRCIARLRRLGEAHGGFAIDTIRTVGYRLVEDGVTRPPSLAVLAFDNLSRDPDLDYFADGVSEEILHAVSRASPLKVIGRASSFRFRDAEKQPSRIAIALDVTHLLDGSVRRSGNRVRIAVRLIEGVTEKVLWTERYECALAECFAVQDEIAQSVTSALGVTVVPHTLPGTVDAFAYDLYQRARELGIAFGKPGAQRRAIALLEEAVTRAPQFAPAWALLAQCRVQHRASDATDAELGPLRLGIVAAAERAVALEPDDGSALACLAFVEPAAGAFARQEAILQRALATRNARGVFAPFSTFCASVGRNREALAAAETAFAHDPLHPGMANWRAILLWQNGRTGESRESVAALARRGDLAGGMLGHAAVLAAYDGDWAFVDRLLTSTVNEGADRGLQAALATLSVLRNPDTAQRALAAARERLAKSGTVPLGTLCLLAHLGLTGEAFSLVEKASFDALTAPDSRSADVGLHILFSPPAAALRGDRRFTDLCARLGLVDYWTNSGRWPDCAGDLTISGAG
jgi:TolB-like protein